VNIKFKSQYNTHKNPEIHKKTHNEKTCRKIVKLESSWAVCDTV
jgi:3-methyladenine DNA glycosylase AlkD